MLGAILESMEILLFLIVGQFVYSLVKDQQFLKHIKDLEYKLMTGDTPETKKDNKNEFTQNVQRDITEIDPEKAIDYIRNKFKK